MSVFDIYIKLGGRGGDVMMGLKELDTKLLVSEFLNLVWHKLDLGILYFERKRD